MCKKKMRVPVVKHLYSVGNYAKKTNRDYYGVANSAGVLDIYEEGPAMTYTEAVKQARIESRGGWMGECWVVRFK
jgi:hypothetical protein